MWGMKPDFLRSFVTSRWIAKEGAIQRCSRVLDQAGQACGSGSCCKLYREDIMESAKKFDRERFVIFCGRSGFIDRVLQDIGKFL